MHLQKAYLRQNNQPVAYASRSLTNTQIAYSQIEKEMLAIVFSCKKFHDYIFGYTVTIETDHKPLVSIFKKDLINAPQRLQSMLLKIQPYKINLVYVPGSTLKIADALSRYYVTENDDFLPDLDSQICLLTKTLPI